MIRELATIDGKRRRSKRGGILAHLCINIYCSLFQAFRYFDTSCCALQSGVRHCLATKPVVRFDC